MFYIISSVIVTYATWMFIQKRIPDQHLFIAAFESILIGLTWPILFVVGIFLFFLSVIVAACFDSSNKFRCAVFEQ